MLSPVSSTSSHDALAPRRKGRVSAEHTLNRVRENQRRHRARRRDHIATLEEKLAETEKQLADARAEIASLKASREAGAWATPKSERNDDLVTEEEKGEKEEAAIEPAAMEWTLVSPTTPIDDQTSTSTSLASPSLSFFDPNLQLNLDLIALFSSPSSTSAQLTLPAQTPSSSTSFDTLPLHPTIPLPIPLELPPLDTLPTGPPPCCNETTDLTPSSLDSSTSLLSSGSAPSTSSPATCLSDPTIPPNPECTTCATRPPPSPSESTTLCSQAYVLIASQNFRGVDAETMRMWLYQGFRRAQRKGEGCRVENGALMGLLDFISGI